jgi:2-dehydro-3-deoxyglucarate aldolase
MGIPGEFDNLKFKKVLDNIIAIGNNSNIASGLHVVEPDVSKLNETIKAGYKFIAYSVDIRMLDVSARIDFNKMKKVVK